MLCAVFACGGTPGQLGPGTPGGALPPEGGSGSGRPDAGPGDAGQADSGTPADADAGTDAGFLPLRHSPIFDENQRPGSGAFRLQAPSTQVAAFADRTSALPGEQVGIRAAAATATSATWQLWRIGYYGGAGGRKVADGTAQLPQRTDPVFDPATGAVRVNWSAAFNVTVPADAVTGAYVVRISCAAGDTYATFVVREPQRAATILYPLSTNTYQAYNQWGGTSLYANARSDWKPWHAYAVSFDRPYDRDWGVGELFSKDRDFIYFAESQGYDIAYATDDDLDRDPGLLQGRRTLLFQGHSEYWTAAERDASEGALANGTNLLVLGANTSFWQVRYADASRRLMFGYKEFSAQDPAAQTDPAHLTCLWRAPPLLRPENSFLGVMYGTWLWADAAATVTDPSSWIWTGANVDRGTLLAGAYGDESDSRYANGAEPAGVAVMVGATVEDHNARVHAAETVLYQARSGAWVFSAGSITWGRALAGVGTWDPRLQQLVANLFSKFAGDGKLGTSALLPLVLPAAAPAPRYRDGVSVSTVTRSLTRPMAVAPAGTSAVVVDGNRIVRVDSGGVVTPVAGGTPGFADGPAAQAQFLDPRGVAVAADGTIYVSDSGNNRIRAISGGTVWTVAGSSRGFADGPGAQAMFAQPMGIALTPAGTLLVADVWNHRLREVTPAGVVRTWAGTGSEGASGGPGATASFYFPLSVTALPSGDAVLAESGSGALRRVSAGATHDVSVFAGTIASHGWSDGSAAAALVSETVGVAALPDGQVAFLDSASARVRAMRSGTVDTLAGGSRGGTVDGAGADAGFSWPRAIAAAPDGTLLVTDASEHALRRITLSR